MDTTLSAILDLYLFPTGRRLHALGRVARRAKAAGFTELAKHCQTAVAHDRGCLALERRWAGVAAESRAKGAQATGADAPAAASKADALVDRTLTAIRDHAGAQAAGAAPDDPIHATVAAFLKEIFPAGVQQVTSQPYVEELASVEHILTQLQGKAMAATIEELGLQRLVKRLAGHAEQYRAALHAPTPEVITFGQVKAAKVEGQENLLEAVAIILGKHHRRTPGDVAARTDLLGPILEQNEIIGATMRARRTVEDVDPETGEPDPTGAAPIPAPAGTGDA